MDITHWPVLRIWASDLPEQVLRLLCTDDLVATLPAQCNDLLIRHDARTGWCLRTNDRNVLSELERFRAAAALPASGLVFHLVVATT